MPRYGIERHVYLRPPLDSHHLTGIPRRIHIERHPQIGQTNLVLTFFIGHGRHIHIRGRDTGTGKTLPSHGIHNPAFHMVRHPDLFCLPGLYRICGNRLLGLQCKREESQSGHRSRKFQQIRIKYRIHNSSCFKD